MYIFVFLVELLVKMNVSDNYINLTDIKGYMQRVGGMTFYFTIV